MKKFHGFCDGMEVLLAEQKSFGLWWSSLEVHRLWRWLSLDQSFFWRLDWVASGQTLKMHSVVSFTRSSVQVVSLCFFFR